VGLGAFSVSLAVEDIEASRVFYETLGFSVFAGDQSRNWLVVRNGDHAIGLFMILEADEGSTGPASFMIVDPDGNTILVDNQV